LNLAEIHNFIDETMKKFRVSYRTGRVDLDGYWVLPQYVNFYFVLNQRKFFSIFFLILRDILIKD